MPAADRPDPSPGDPRRDPALAPTPEQRRAFVRRLTEIGVPGWKSAYRAKVDDGTRWTVLLDYDGISLSSSGSNAFPDRFQDFTALVRTLVGGRRFE